MQLGLSTRLDSVRSIRACQVCQVDYIEVHGYRPPEEFIAAVMRSPLPENEEYQVITEPFWHLHSAACAGKGMTTQELVDKIHIAIEQAREQRR